MRPASPDPREPLGRPRRLRLTLARKLTASLAAMAVLSTALAVIVQDRTLSRDLRRAAEARLERAAHAAEQIVDSHLQVLEDRYRAVSGTPQIRATLEIADAPTLTYFADELRERHGPAAVEFLDANGAVAAHSGHRGIADLSRSVKAPGVMMLGERLYGVVSVPLETAGQRVGAMVVTEEIEPSTLARWSELCGVEIRAGALPSLGNDAILRRIREREPVELAVVADLAAERAALEAARGKLLWAGATALLVALAACAALARSLVRPIRAIQATVDRVRGGDLTVRLQSRRGDEIGDVARGVDLMLDNIRVSHDALDRRVAELRRSQAHLAKAQQLARVGSFTYDPERREVVGSVELWAIYGIDAGGKGVPIQELVDRIHPEDRQAAIAAVQGCLESSFTAHLDLRVTPPDGSERFCHAQFQMVEDGGEQRLEGTVQDITDRRRAEEQIRYLAYHDGLTGLGNRQLFAERMEIATAQARRHGARFGVLFLDLDHFKRINDTLGHRAGDDLLRDVADRLVRSVRETDLITRSTERRFDAAVSRLGGDEFTILITDLEDPSVLASIAQRILEALRRPYALEGQELVISASIGIATWPADGESVDALLSNADSAMYHAKSVGRNAYQFYNQSMNATALRRLQLEGRLRHAIEHDELALHYQPRIELGTGRVCGFEALARWRDAELGVVSPADFIPVAEQTGLIAPLGRWVVRRVCQQIAAWERELGALDLRVSCNVSAREFGPELAGAIVAVVDELGVNPLRLQIEITESAILRDEETVIATLGELRARGISIALDDFGTGYSSLGHLRRLPVDTLKIDRSFVAPIERSREAAALTRSIVSMGRALGLRVVAEGVETREQRELLERWRCDEIQGFLISAAVPPEQAARWLRSER